MLIWVLFMWDAQTTLCVCMCRQVDAPSDHVPTMKIIAAISYPMFAVHFLVFPFLKPFQIWQHMHFQDGVVLLSLISRT